LHDAKITTIGARAEDMFYVTDKDDLPIDCPDKKHQIRATIIRHLNEDR